MRTRVYTRARIRVRMYRLARHYLLLMNALSEPGGLPQRSYGRVNPVSARRENGRHNEQTHVQVAADFLRLWPRSLPVDIFLERKKERETRDVMVYSLPFVGKIWLTRSENSKNRGKAREI